MDLVRYVAVNDVGNVGNPAVVDGQMHGNIALGVGQALFEGAVYDRDGLLLTGDLTNYAIPRATDMPSFELDRTVTPTPLNPLGAKGAGDVANPAVPPAIVNAVCDARVGSRGEGRRNACDGGKGLAALAPSPMGESHHRPRASGRRLRSTCRVLVRAIPLNVPEPVVLTSLLVPFPLAGEG